MQHFDNHNNNNRDHYEILIMSQDLGCTCHMISPFSLSSKALTGDEKTQLRVELRYEQACSTLEFVFFHSDRDSSSQQHFFLVI